MSITIKDEAGAAGMRLAGRLASEVLDYLTPFVKPGITTNEIDRLAHDYMTQVQGTVPAPLGYQPPGYAPYPKSLCTSVNHVVCHGIPSERTLREGDLANLDVTVIVDGWHGDTSRMYGVGKVPARARRLVEVTYDAFQRGLEVVRPGATTGDIGAAIQAWVESQRCSVVRDFCGHGLGRVFHDAPNILHYGKKGTGEVLRPGMFFTIEPMVNLGKWQVKILSDGWTAVTRDKSLSAQCEHSVGVTETGYEVFTASPAGLFQPPIQAD